MHVSLFYLILENETVLKDYIVQKQRKTVKIYGFDEYMIYVTYNLLPFTVFVAFALCFIISVTQSIFGSGKLPDLWTF